MKKTGRTVAILLLLAVVAATGAGCGSGEPAKLSVTAEEAAAAIVAQVDFEADLVPISADALSNWYTLDDSVASYAIYINASVVPAEEVAVLAGESAGDIEALEAILAKRRDYLEQTFESYQPAELEKIQNPVLVSKGNFAVMALTNDPEAAATIESILQ